MKEVSYYRFLDDENSERLRIRFKTDKGELIYVVVQFESLINGNWMPIIRYDCAHGFFHRDVILPNGEKEKEAIAIINLKDAFYYAEQDIKDRWQFYKERYLKKNKK